MLRSTDESLARALTRRAAQLTLVGALAATPLALATGTASATDWDAIAQCESSGNWHTSTGNGYGGGLQFTDSTWHAFGGSGQPENASREQQIQVAEKVKGSQGMGAWPVCSKKAGGSSSSSSTSSSSSSSSGSASSSGSTTSVETKPVEATTPAASSGGSYTVASGDTLSDIAAAHGTTAQAIAQHNGIANPDVLTPGQKLTVG
jgi:resuscitation-promoting factor RpfA